MTARLLSVNVGQIVDAEWAGSIGRTAIDKRPAAGRVDVRTLGLAGDAQADTRAHGGADKAVYAYAHEDARWWEQELGRALPYGQVGENLSTEGLDVTGAEIGERWRIGAATLEVSEPRIPCRVFAGFWAVPDLVKRFTVRGWPGAYLRVVEEGLIGAGDDIDVVHRPGHGVTIGSAFRAKSGERDLIWSLFQAPELPAAWHEWARKVLAAG